VEKQDRIYVAGNETILGRAVADQLQRQGYTNLIGTSSCEPNLTDGKEVDRFFRETRPDYVFLTAGKAGGIKANQLYPADFLLDNLLVGCHVIHSAHRYGSKKLLYFASSCSYPRLCRQPMQTDALMSGPLEPTNEAYALAKIAGIKLCQAYRQQYGADMVSVIPADVFGPGDEFGSESSHVVPALIGRIHEAKLTGADSVTVWGSGAAQRDFIFVDDVVDAALFVMEKFSPPEPINIGGSAAVSIRELAELIKAMVGYGGVLQFDASKPDGMPVKVLDSSRLQTMGWRPRTTLRTGLEKTYNWFLETRLS